ncbi:hypothetical protein EV363DRAFT_1541247 [Boletus edulis]|nr:hypothetical protein EV363DRAFT_1541247 [Boletus edulis]
MTTSLEGVLHVPLHVSSTNSMHMSKEKDLDTQCMFGSISGDLLKKEQKKHQRRSKDEQSVNVSASFKVGSFSAKEAQDTSSLNGSTSRSLQPSPTTVTPHPPSCVVDEDYDKGVADALIVLSQSHIAPMHSPTLSNGSRHTVTSLCPGIPHHGSVSMSDVDDLDNKRMRHADAGHAYLPSLPTISMSLPPHLCPIGSSHGSHPSSSVPIALPPIATLSPVSTAPSPTDNRMAID